MVEMGGVEPPSKAVSRTSTTRLVDVLYLHRTPIDRLSGQVAELSYAASNQLSWPQHSILVAP